MNACFSFICLALGAVIAISHVHADEIHEAARRGDAAAVASLAQVDRASINRRDGPYRYTPLHLAVIGGHLDVVRVLAAIGADLNVPARSGCSPLKLAVGLGKDAIVDLLTSRGAQLIEPPRVVCIPPPIPIVVPERPQPRERSSQASSFRGGGYQHVGSECEACGGAVPKHSRVGDSCQHCGVTWGYKRFKYLN